MSISLRLLLIEDSEDDALLLQRILRKGGYDLVGYRRVDNEADLRDALENGAWDIVITDYSMPGFDGIVALEVFKSYGLDTPLIIVSGTIGEQVAVNAMKAGAHDYVMKDSLARLVPAIQRELNDAQARSARRRAEDQVRQLSMAVEQSPSMVIITDTQGSIEYVNPTFCSATGYTPEEVLGQNPRILKGGRIPPEEYARLWNALKSGSEWRGEMRNRRKDGSYYWASAVMAPIRNAAGQITHFVSVQEDITQRREAEDALRRSEVRFRQLVEQAGDAILVVDRTGRVLDGNQQACASVGSTYDELRSLTVYDFDTEATPQDVEAIWHACQTEVVTRRTRYRRPDGSTFPVELRIAAVDQLDQVALLAIARDVTEREQFNEALQMYNEQLEDLVQERTHQLRRNIQQTEAILESSSDAIALAESNGDIRTTNPAFKTLFGSRVNRAIEQLLHVVTETEHIEAVTQALYAVLKQGEAARVEARILSLDGAEIDMDIAMTPVRNHDDHENIGIVVSLRDITELKEINRFKTRFVANAAHDLANPISNLKLYLHALEQTPEHSARYMEVLQGQTRRMEHLVNDLRMLSQLDRGTTQFNLEPMDLHCLLTDIIAVHEAQAAANQQDVVYQPAAESAMVLADRSKLERVIVNLLTNALNYTPPGGTITIGTRLEDRTFCLLVADTGIGIAPQDLPNIFERFYRSDDAKLAGVEGTGLGLAIVKEIVEAHRGTIAVSSTPGEGSQFRVTLPRYTG